MTWEDVTVDGEKLRGFEPSDFTQPESEVLNDELIIETVIDAAKSTVRDLLLGSLHELALQKGEDVLFDEISDAAPLSGRLSMALCYAYLHVFYRGNYILDGDAKVERAAYYWDRLTMTIKPFADMVRTTLADPDVPIEVGKSGSSFQRTTTDWWSI